MLLQGSHSIAIFAAHVLRESNGHVLIIISSVLYNIIIILYCMCPALRKGTINFETFNNYYFSAQYVGCTLQCNVVLVEHF